MKNYIQLFIAAVAAISTISCAQAPVAEHEPAYMKVSRDYEASEQISGYRPYIYGNRTILEFASTPFGLSIKDENGAAVGYKREGRYYLLDRKLDYFTVTSGGHQVTFTSIARDEPASLPPLESNSEPKTDPKATSTTRDEPTLVTGSVSRSDTPALKLMKTQLTHLRQLYNKASAHGKTTGEELFALNKKLDSLESRMNLGVAVIQINFPNFGTKPNPDKDTLNALVSAAQTAEKLIISGRTNSLIAGKSDAAIAINRAKNTKQLLVDHGISENKIEIGALASGDFIAPTYRTDTRALNRRVEIEIVPNTHI